MNDQSHRPPPAKKGRKRKLHPQQHASNERLEEILADLDYVPPLPPPLPFIQISTSQSSSDDEGTTAPV